MKIRATIIIVNAIAALLIFVFAYTVISKFFNYQIFQFNLKEAPLVGDNAPFVAVFLSVINSIPVFLLTIPFTRKAGFIYSFILLFLYAAYLSYALLVAHQLPCSCSGIVPWLNWKNHLWVNLVLATLSVIALLFSKRIIAINPPVPASTGNRQS
ncbi:MAG: hypothetical protein DI535_10785 [Citrobacter freundii]|nr:MAG: hypothetical protein DI535_10785 [Citrobacter freundii]